MVEYNSAMYSYLHNQQGDIIGIIDANGTLVVEYKYDVWGKPILTTDAFTSTLVNLNPFRYRGYIWDNESCLYCLCTRYYDYCYNRFLNADIFIGQIKRTFASNIFVYCYNGPVISIDSDGLDAVTVFVYTEKFSYGHAEIGFVDSNGQRIVYSFGRYADDAEKTDIVGEGILVIYQGSDVKTSWNEHTGSPKSNGFWFKVDATDDQIKNMRSYINGLIENGKPYRGKSSSRRPKYVIGTYHIIEQNCVVLVREVLRAGFGKDLPKLLNNVWTPTGLKRKLDRLSEKRYFIYARNECMK